ncbi:alpha/beta hydrolase [Streptomyces globosus]|uniref:alpha/beta hydrolase n=1 Tax=Streptomyces globosus TaxID=68209 RepID=UPI003820AF6E
MGLTSDTLLACVVLATLLLGAVTVWQWPRLGGRGPGRVIGRIGILLLAQVCVLASVGLVSNRTFLFYDSWSDLVGAKQQVAASPGGAAVQVLGRKAPAVPGGADPRVGGVIEKVVVHGELSRTAAPAYVYLPPEYFAKGAEQRRFPAAVVLTGFPGMAENLMKKLEYPQTAWKLAKQKKAQPMVLVMMRPTIAAANTQCVDVPGGPQSETFYGTDLVKAVAATYRVGTSARNWGVIGNSTGGYCAMKMAVQHPESFSVGVGLSAEYRPEIDRESGDLFQGNKDEEKRSDLLWHLDNRPQGASSFLVTSSLTGEPNYKETTEFVAKVKAPARVSSIILDSGGHNFKTWRREVPPALAWMSGRLTAD